MSGWKKIDREGPRCQFWGMGNHDVPYNFYSIWLYVAVRATCSKPKLPHKQPLQIEKKPWMGSQYGAQHALPKWGKLYLVALIFHLAPIILGISTQKFNFNIHLLCIHGGIERMEIIQKMAYVCMCTWIYSALEPIGAFISWTHTLIENYQSPNKNFDVELREASMTSFPYPCLVSLILTR